MNLQLSKDNVGMFLWDVYTNVDVFHKSLSSIIMDKVNKLLSGGRYNMRLDVNVVNNAIEVILYGKSISLGQLVNERVVLFYYGVDDFGLLAGDYWTVDTLSLFRGVESYDWYFRRVRVDEWSKIRELRLRERDVVIRKARVMGIQVVFNDYRLLSGIRVKEDVMFSVLRERYGLSDSSGFYSNLMNDINRIIVDTVQENLQKCL